MSEKKSEKKGRENNVLVNSDVVEIGLKNQRSQRAKPYEFNGKIARHGKGWWRGK
jgi:hypothetical protein